MVHLNHTVQMETDMTRPLILAAALMLATAPAFAFSLPYLTFPTAPATASTANGK
jgi:hypothetical protein